MKFTVSGLIEERNVSMTWNDGALEGDVTALDELVALALYLDGRAVGPDPEGPFTYQDHLCDPLSTFVLMEDVLDEVLDCEGQLPQSRRQAA